MKAKKRRSSIRISRKNFNTLLVCQANQKKILKFLSNIKNFRALFEQKKTTSFCFFFVVFNILTISK
jgi:hypothetical protein